MKVGLNKLNFSRRFKQLNNCLRRSAAKTREACTSQRVGELEEQSVQPQRVVHGVIIEENRRGSVYSLDPSKRVPFTYDFTFCKDKEHSPHIKNLTNELERVNYNGLEFETLFDEQPHLSRTVGSLPQKWGRKIGNSPEKREQVDNLFSEFARRFHKKVKDEYSEVTVNTRKLQKGLSEALSEDVKISPLGKGAWGHTYKINVGSQDYVLKVFYNRSPKGYGTPEHYYGNFNELSSAVWASKHDADSYAMFYMGRFGEKQDGYILTRYLPNREQNNKIYNGMSDMSDKNFVFSRYLHRMRCGDEHGTDNIIDKKICDFGYCYISTAAKMGEKTFKIARNLGRALDENNSKALETEIAKHQGTKEFEQAKSFLQYLINEYTTEYNYKVLQGKKDLLAQLGMDCVPDIRYVLSILHFPTKSDYNTHKYSEILGLPEESFKPLWLRFNKEKQSDVDRYLKKIPVV